MTDSERDPDPTPEDEAPPASDGAPTPGESDDGPIIDDPEGTGSDD